MPIKKETRDSFIKRIELKLGGGMIDVELDRDHYELAIDEALERYRQRSDHATDESFLFMKLDPERQSYTLPDEVIEVQKIYRRNFGLNMNSSNFEPFEAQFMNNYMLNTSNAGGLAVYDAAAQHRELLGRMFGAELMFTWNSSTKQLFIHRKLRADDEVFIHVYNYKPEEVLFNDTYSFPWIRDFAIAKAKMMLGEARSKFSAIAGPAGGTTLNGDAIKAEAQADMERLEEEMKNFVASSRGWGFIIG